MNFRHLKESNSLHLEEQSRCTRGNGYTKGTRMDRGGEDLFGAFSSVTLHYDGDS